MELLRISIYIIKTAKKYISLCQILKRNDAVVLRMREREWSGLWNEELERTYFNGKKRSQPSLLFVQQWGILYLLL
jgi:hypothetical protein